MSAQDLSRLAALLTLDVGMMRDYVPKYAGDDRDKEEDLNESKRSDLAHRWRGQLDDEEKQLVVDGDMNAILSRLAKKLKKPVNGESTETGEEAPGGEYL